MFFLETWFSDTSDTKIAGYKLHRTDRNGRRGGVAIYTQEEIVTIEVQIAHLNSTDIEQAWLILRYRDESFLLGCIYRPHDFNDNYLSKVIASIVTAKRSLVSLNCTAMLLYGDFNFSNTWYEELDISGGVGTAGHVVNDHPSDLKFQECLENYHLTQLATFPTYRSTRLVAPKTTLDLIITDDPDRFIKKAEEDSFGEKLKGQAHCLITGSFEVAGIGSLSISRPR